MPFPPKFSSCVISSITTTCFVHHMLQRLINGFSLWVNNEGDGWQQYTENHGLPQASLTTKAFPIITMLKHFML